MGATAHRQTGAGLRAEPLLLLAGKSAVSLAQRLAASGYATVDWLSAGVAASYSPPDAAPVAAVLAADQAGLIRDLRQRFGSMPILLDLDQDSVSARAACLQSGADDFWLSGTGPSDLLLRLRLHRTIRDRLGQRPSVLQLEDLSLDPSTRLVRRGRRVVALTAREYMLLQVLMRRSGRVFSRDELMREVWQDERSGSNVVEVYVRYLRQKLEADGESRLLHTVRGRGYCLGQVQPED
ncbi:MAG: winged helix-turn-helix domain-containing protein [Cyanobacteriota bacterium]|nr:winged helix-turn-helix domain-containing protein [Cyanobacteriota bacterium]